MPSPRIEENTPARDEAGNSNALRKFAGNETGERTFVDAWLGMQPKAAHGMDRRDPLPPTGPDRLTVPRGGRPIKCGRGRTVVESVSRSFLPHDRRVRNVASRTPV